MGQEDNKEGQESKKKLDQDLDFDLPEIDDDAPKVIAKRIHIGGSTCESCEG